MSQLFEKFVGGNRQSEFHEFKFNVFYTHVFKIQNLKFSFLENFENSDLKFFLCQNRKLHQSPPPPPKGHALFLF